MKVFFRAPVLLNLCSKPITGSTNCLFFQLSPSFYRNLAGCFDTPDDGLSILPVEFSNTWYGSTGTRYYRYKVLTLVLGTLVHGFLTLSLERLLYCWKNCTTVAARRKTKRNFSDYKEYHVLTTRYLVRVLQYDEVCGVPKTC